MTLSMVEWVKLQKAKFSSVESPDHFEICNLQSSIFNLQFVARRRLAYCPPFDLLRVVSTSNHDRTCLSVPACVSARAGAQAERFAPRSPICG
jgi:hypothetical protein